jgi:hypothetical protein
MSAESDNHHLLLLLFLLLHKFCDVRWIRRPIFLFFFFFFFFFFFTRSLVSSAESADPNLREKLQEKKFSRNIQAVSHAFLTACRWDL